MLKVFDEVECINAFESEGYLKLGERYTVSVICVDSNGVRSVMLWKISEVGFRPERFKRV